jgi:hypothetical protein
MRDAVERLWPELEWIENPELREATTRTWVVAVHPQGPELPCHLHAAQALRRPYRA